MKVLKAPYWIRGGGAHEVFLNNPRRVWIMPKEGKSCNKATFTVKNNRVEMNNLKYGSSYLSIKALDFLTGRKNHAPGVYVIVKDTDLIEAE